MGGLPGLTRTPPVLHGESAWPESTVSVGGVRLGKWRIVGMLGNPRTLHSVPPPTIVWAVRISPLLVGWFASIRLTGYGSSAVVESRGPGVTSLATS